MPVSPCPARTPTSPLSSASCISAQRSRSRWFWPRALLAAAVVLAALAAVASMGLFFLTNGLPELLGNSQRSSVVQPVPARMASVPGASADTALSGGCTSGSRTVWGSNLTVARSDHLCGNMDVYGGNATIDGTVEGNITVVGGSATVDGNVTGNVTAIGGDVLLGARADVGGNVDALGGNVTKAPTAIVGGNIEHGFTFHGFSPLSWLGLTGGFVMRWWSMLFWGIAAALTAIFFPRQLRNVRTVLRRAPAQSFAAGFGALILGGIVALVLLFTCIGIPVALALGVALWLAWVLGTVALGLWIGEGLLRLGGSSDRSPVLAAVLGVLLLTLCESVPCVGGILGLVAGFTGLGASALALLHTRQAAAMRSHFI